MRFAVLCIILILASIAGCFTLIMLGYTKFAFAVVFLPVLLCPLLSRFFPDTPRNRNTTVKKKNP